MRLDSPEPVNLGLPGTLVLKTSLSMVSAYDQVLEPKALAPRHALSFNSSDKKFLRLARMETRQAVVRRNTYVVEYRIC